MVSEDLRRLDAVSDLEFVSALIGHVFSWPVAVVVVALLFRRPLGDLIPQIQSYEGMGQKVTFGQKMAQTEASVDAAVSSIEGATSEDREAPDAGRRTEEPPESDDLTRQAEANPSYVILTAWEQLSGALDDLVGAVQEKLETGHGRPRLGQPVTRLRELERHKIINQQFVQAVNDLRELRNRVAHGQHNPSPGEAVAYVASAHELSRAAHVLAQPGYLRSIPRQ